MTCSTPACPIDVEHPVGQLDLALAAELGGHLAHLADGGHGGAGHAGDEVGPGLEGQAGDLGTGLGDAHVGEDLLVREEGPDGAHGVEALAQDEDGAALDDIDIGRGLLEGAERAGQVGCVQGDLEPGGCGLLGHGDASSPQPARGSKAKKVAALPTRRSWT